MGFREIAPGVMVSDGIKVQIPHPDPCWVITNNNDPTVAVSSGPKMLLVFSSREHASSFMDKQDVPESVKKDFSPVVVTWDELIGMFGELYSACIVDHEGEPGFYAQVPLSKKI